MNCHVKLLSLLLRLDNDVRQLRLADLIKAPSIYISREMRFNSVIILVDFNKRKKKSRGNV